MILRKLRETKDRLGAGGALGNTDTNQGKFYSKMWFLQIHNAILDRLKNWERGF